MKTLSKYYPVTLWLLTLFIAPLVMFIAGWANEGLKKSTDGFSITLLITLFGAIFSLPALALTYFTFLSLNRILSSKILVVIAIDVVSIVGIYVTFFLIEGSMSNYLSLIYSISVMLASLVYLIKSIYFKSQTQ